jgi:hypothetical protein
MAKQGSSIGDSGMPVRINMKYDLITALVITSSANRDLSGKYGQFSAFRRDHRNTTAIREIPDKSGRTAG